MWASPGTTRPPTPPVRSGRHRRRFRRRPVPAGASTGQSIVFVLMTLGVLALVVALAWAFRLYTPSPRELARPERVGNQPARLEDLPLPAGLAIDLSDPWAEAQRLRAAGELAGATVALFVHLLVTLDRRGLSRLAPGKTARQLVRGVGDLTVRRRVEPTLRLFEEVYYGRREPVAEVFEAAWSEALALRPLWTEGAPA